MAAGDLVKADFGMLDDLSTQLRNTLQAIQQEMDSWAQTVGVTGAAWLDGAGEQFGEVSAAWNQVSAAQQEMLDALAVGVVNANADYFQTLHAAIQRVGSLRP
jgi:uncharacterized protein YukE